MATPQTLASLKDDSWFTDFQRSSILIRLYPSINVPRDLIERAYKHKLTLLEFRPPVKIGLIEVREWDITDLHISYHSDESGLLAMSIRDIPLKLSPGIYAYMSSPLDVDGKRGDLFACKRSLDVASSLLVCLIGRAFAYSKVFEQEVWLSDGSAHARVRSHGLGSASDQGPFINQKNWQLAGAICTGLRATSPGLLHRLELSFNFLTKAIELREEGFFEYWTALEVLSAGAAPKIRAQIQAAYGWSRPHDVDMIFNFGRISKMRHDMVHRGIIPKVPRGLERLMHLLFLDILCYMINVPVNGLALSYIKESDFDISLSLKQLEERRSDDTEPLTPEVAAMKREKFRMSWIDFLDRLGY
jgi:hypothetical protein